MPDRQILRFFYTSLCFFFFFTLALRAWADLTINLIAVNGSESEEKEIEVSYDLPKELKPEEILDTEPLKLNYDVDKQLYFVHAKIKFKPKESMTFKIKVKDVWSIKEEDIKILKNQLKDNLDTLADSENYSYAVTAKEKLEQQMDFIIEDQKNFSENIGRRIEQYRAHADMLARIRENVYDIDYLKYESKDLAAMKTEEKTVKLILSVKNPDDKKAQTLKHKHYLPEEVREFDIVEKQGFEVRFDQEKNRAFLTKEEEFGPGEEKKYEILIRDIWIFPLSKVEAIVQRTELANKELKDSAYAESAAYLTEQIMQKVTEIKDSQAQSADLDIQQHIGQHRMNTQRYEEAKADVEKIEALMAIVRAKKLENLEKGKVKNVLSKLKALRGLSALAEAVFKQGISIETTWKVIISTVSFVALFTALNFLLWAKRSKTMGEELAPKEGGIKTVPKPGENEPAKEA